MTVPEKITKLIDLFNRNIEAYKSGHYKETQVRHEFIDPFFIMLGWDVNNENGYAEAYKDVIHEDSIKVGGIPKAPDYCFRIGGVRKFFLEAKKPSVYIKEETHPAYQLRRYAWSAKLPLSILTDFEEFAIYDCRIKPVKTDKASTARIRYFTYKEYHKNWAEIASIFSQESILKGSFDKYVESSKAKRGTAEVDKAFLKEIELWREILARNIALRNARLTRRELNFAVQRTIDRIIFLRICEDRGIEDYETLMILLNGTNVYKRLCEIFYRADERYNSGLFHFRIEKGYHEPPDELTTSLIIDDKPIKDIIKNLYYPDSPYEFSVLPADILGQVYEQFLGKVIRLTSGHRAVVEDKPEVKKAGGVYYTPTYIVDYIVKNTVGKLLENKTPQQVQKLKILDPACGSGSFLIGAYQYLLDWHREWYEKNNPEKWVKSRKPRLYKGSGGDWRLTTDERKRILLNNIYGVDIDPQAVEVTKLSLLLKVLEGENEQTLGIQRKLFHQRALPNLSSNIKCGNSLIGPDFYEGKQFDLFDEEERYRINVFDWDAEYPEIMKSGGFDAVIGNPPYVRVDAIPKINKSYYTKIYGTSKGKYDIYYLFIEKSIILLKSKCYLGFIVPNKFCTSDSGITLRKLLSDYSSNIFINSVSKLSVFKKAKNYPVILFIRKLSNKKNKKIQFAYTINENELSSNVPIILSLHHSEIEKIPESIFPINVCREKIDIYFKVFDKSTKLSKYLKISEGFRIPTILEKSIGDEHIVKQYQFSRYSIIKKGVYINKEDRAKIISNSSERYHNSFSDKILIAEDALKIEATIDYSIALCQGGVYFAVKQAPKNMNININFLLGILNSSLQTNIYKTLFGGMHMGGGYLRYRTRFLNHLPIININLSNPIDKCSHDRMVELVETMLSLHKDLAKEKTTHDKEVIQRQINATDRQIDSLVYELYGLTEEEIKIVEEETK